MKPEIKKRWVEALRSGEYQQTTDSMHDSTLGGFCCLGVLGHLYCKDSNLDFDAYVDRCSNEVPFVDQAFSDWIGDVHVDVGADGVRSTFNPWVRTRGYPNPVKIAVLNDHGATFSELADLIEAQL